MLKIQDNGGIQLVNVTFMGNAVSLLGDEMKVGDKAQDFTVLDNDLNEKTLSDFPGVRLISVVPSIDTGVCDAQTRKFNEEVEQLSGVNVLTISVDLPFAQKRWCGDAGLEDAVTLSDHRALSFGQAFGVAIDGLRLLTRAVFVVDASGTITYVQYVNEVTDHPDYDAALEAAKRAQ